MKIFIACSKHFYERIPSVAEYLQARGHVLTMPNSYDNPMMEEQIKKLNPQEHVKWKAMMLRRDEENIRPNDAILVLNYEKNGQPNYIGGATFLEMFKAWEMRKKLFLLNPIPDNLLRDEIIGFDPIILNGNLERII